MPNFAMIQGPALSLTVDSAIFYSLCMMAGSSGCEQSVAVPTFTLSDGRQLWLRAVSGSAYLYSLSWRAALAESSQWQCLPLLSLMAGSSGCEQSVAVPTFTLSDGRQLLL